MKTSTADAIPARIDDESRRVLEYVNRESARHERGAREYPVEAIRAAARERLDRYARHTGTQ